MDYDPILEQLDFDPSLRREPPLNVAFQLIRERFKGTTATFIGSHALSSTVTPTSDLQILVITPTASKPAYRETLHRGGWPVELFVCHPSTWSILRDHELAEETTYFTDICAYGHLLVDNSQAKTLQREARRLLEAGPAPLTHQRLDPHRHTLTDLYLDLYGATDPIEQLFLGSTLSTEISRLTLLQAGLWPQLGKRAGRALKKLNPNLANRLEISLCALANGNTYPLLALTREILAGAGGPFDYGQPLPPPDPAPPVQLEAPAEITETSESAPRARPETLSFVDRPGVTIARLKKKESG